MRDHAVLILSILYLAFGAVLATVSVGWLGAFWFLLGAVYAAQVGRWVAYAKDRKALRKWKEAAAAYRPVLPDR